VVWREIRLNESLGFSFLEVILALVIIGILFPLLVGVFTSSRYAVKDGEFELVALRLAENVMEEARHVARSGGDVHSLAETDQPAAEPNSSYLRTVRVENEGDDPDIPAHLIRVTVTVTWERFRADGSLQLSSLIFVPED
jgi:type II secretory pathway pseudopilin PulG